MILYKQAEQERKEPYRKTVKYKTCDQLSVKKERKKKGAQT